ncbi:MAG: spore protease YyaC [Selenomonadales bacterium]|nr:spore protease YyaC [Selenomonadales bacterium]
MISSAFPPASLTDALRAHLTQPYALGRPILIVCIGTDRSTGDSFGPFTGSLLQSATSYPYIYGTLRHPIHSKNYLAETAPLYETFADPYIIAVDASLGMRDMIGSIRVRQGSLRPAAAFSRDLPPIGDLAVTGIVGASGGSDYLTLQSTRLGLVAHMASQLASALCASLPSDTI